MALSGCVAIAVSAAFYPVSRRVVDVSAGERVFKARCASCHAAEEGGATLYGPALYGISTWGAMRQPGTAALDYVITSIVTPGAFRAADASGEMPERAAHGLSDSEILSVVAFLMGQGGEVPYGALARYELPRQSVSRDSAVHLQLSSLEQGRALFFGKAKCADCHSVVSVPGSDLIAPDLSRAGLHSRAFLRKSIVDSHAEIRSGYEEWTVISDGRVATGRRIPRGDGSLLLVSRDETGGLQLREFDTAALESDDEAEVVRSTRSAMPDYHNQLSPAELEALLDFLSALR